ncbi:MAG: hypothetical protein K2O69_04785, partial [Odoribacter sp.]|nr:hypothetical protein [Odoribacter sp.]
AYDPLTESFILSHPYSDDAPFHVIYFCGSPSAIQHLSVDQNKLIFLDVANNENLSFFSCSNNELDTLDLTGCNALKTVIASVNELRSIDISHLEYLELLQLDYNKELTHAEISNHQYLHTLDIGNSGIKNLTLSDNPNLAYLFLEKVDLDTLNGLPVDGSNFNFADLTALKELDVAETKFITSLDISNNPYLSLLNITYSQINRLNISNGAIAIVFANGSKLKDLIYTPSKILNLYNLNIIGTPFEREESPLYTFFTSGLPDRSHSDQKGYLYISTPLQPVITALIPYLEKKNWEVRQ